MVIRCCLTYIFVLLIYKVSLEVTVKNFVGESAILLCSYTEDINQVDTVFWRHNDSKKVYEFISNGSQEVKYNDRVKSFPEPFKNGNYSIKIEKLEKNDEGEYTCFITPADHYENMYLIIKDKGKPSETLIEGENTPTKPWIIPVVVVVFLVIVLFCVFFFLYKKFPQFFKSK